AIPGRADRAVPYSGAQGHPAAPVHLPAPARQLDAPHRRVGARSCGARDAHHLAQDGVLDAQRPGCDGGDPVPRPRHRLEPFRLERGRASPPRLQPLRARARPLRGGPGARRTRTAERVHPGGHRGRHPRPLQHLLPTTRPNQRRRCTWL
ncbi:MAG: hypothetical protein AVDCRST_MAG50-790, partial [uncultured Acidimicrobiales bacterium]